MMEIIDIILGIILLYGLIKGISKGFFAEIAALVALLAGIYCAMHFSFYAQDFLTKLIDWNPKYISLAAFAITFIIVVVVISLVGKMLTKLAKMISLGWLNNVLGGVFGLLKVAVILSVLIGWIEKANGIIPFVKKEQTQNSILYEPVKSVVPIIFPKLMDILDKPSSTPKKENKSNDNEEEKQSI